MIDYEIGADGIAVIAWNMVERSMNVLNDASIARFAAAVEAAIKDAAVKGVIITSKKRDFLAGADLTELGRGADAASLTAFAARIVKSCQTVGQNGHRHSTAIQSRCLRVSVESLRYRAPCAQVCGHTAVRVHGSEVRAVRTAALELAGF